MINLLLFFYLLLNPISSAEVGNESVSVGVYDIKPWFYKEKGVYKGLLYDNYVQLSKSSGVKFNFILGPYKRIKRDFKNGKFDMIADLKASSTLNHATPIGELSKISLIIMGKKNKVLSFKKEKIKSGRKFNLCVLRGAEYLVKKFDYKVNYVFVTHLTQCLKMLKRSRVDLLQMSTSGLKEMIKNGKIGRGVYDHYIFSEMSSVVLVHSQMNKNLRKRIKNSLVNKDSYPE